MKKSKAEIMLHPIRMRILCTLLGGRSLTTSQIASQLSDIPQATLYRQVQALLKSEIIKVIDEQQVRGATEKLLTLHEHGSNVSADDLDPLSKDEHLHMFQLFTATLLDHYSRYLQQPTCDLVSDRVSFRQMPVWVTDDEFDQMILQMRKPLEQALQNEQTTDRRKRLIAIISIPEPRGGLS